MKAKHIIKAWAKSQGFRIDHIAAQVPVRPSTLSRWMSGKQMPDARSRKRMTDITGLSLENETDWILPRPLS